MLESTRLSIRLSEMRSAINKLQIEPAPTPEQRSDRDRLAGELETVEVEYRQALSAEDAAANVQTHRTPDAETREREAIRAECRAFNYILNHGRLTGPEAEFAAAAGVSDGIPLALFDPPAETRAEVETRADTVSAAPSSGTGVNLAPIAPAVFADSLAPRLGIDLPTVESGTFSTATITTSLTAGAKSKDAAAESTAASLTTTTTTPKRITARLTMRAEDRALVGAADFDAALRSNLSAVLSAEFDDLAINGNGSDPNPHGLLSRLTDPTAESTTDTFTTYVEKQAGVIEGLWSRTLGDVFLLLGVDSYKHAAAVFRGQDDTTSALSYLTRVGGGVETHKRMPAAASNVQAAIAYRRGRPGMRTAVMPIWNRVSIDDMYTDSAKAQTHVTMHVLCGDVIVVQPDAYGQLSYKVA